MCCRQETEVFIEHEKTKRTIIPTMSDAPLLRSGKKKPPMAVRSSATAIGSIVKLIEQTPENIIKSRRCSEKRYECNDIFQPLGFQKLISTPIKTQKKRPEYVFGSSCDLSHRGETNRSNRYLNIKNHLYN